MRKYFKAEWSGFKVMGCKMAAIYMLLMALSSEIWSRFGMAKNKMTNICNLDTLCVQN
jgi:hypothetical protein